MNAIILFFSQVLIKCHQGKGFKRTYIFFFYVSLDYMFYSSYYFATYHWFIFYNSVLLYFGGINNYKNSYYGEDLGLWILIESADVAW